MSPIRFILFLGNISNLNVGNRNFFLFLSSIGKLRQSLEPHTDFCGLV